MAYTSAELISAHLGRSGASAGDRIYDEAIQAALTVDQAVDDWCGRTFAKSADVREFRPARSARFAQSGGRELFIGDVVTVSQVETRRGRADPWAVVDAEGWELGPPGRRSPPSALWRLGAVWPTAPMPTATVRVSAVFGWETIPDPVRTAAMFWGCALVQEMSIPVVDAAGDVIESGSDSFSFIRKARRELAAYRRIPVA